MAILYLLLGYLKLPRKFITGLNSWAAANVCRRRSVTQTLRVWTVVPKDQRRIFFSAVKHNNHRNAHQRLPSLICVSQQSSWLTQMSRRLCLRPQFAEDCGHVSYQTVIDQISDCTDDHCGKIFLSGLKGYPRSMSQVEYSASEQRLWKRVINTTSQSSCPFRRWEKKKQPSCDELIHGGGDANQFPFRWHSRGDG